MKILIFRTVHLLFYVYTLMLMVRVLGSWIPEFSRTKFMRVVALYTDPYLHLFQKIIPPIRGVLDLSPIVAFFALYLLEKFILTIIALFWKIFWSHLGLKIYLFRIIFSILLWRVAQT